MHMHDIYIAYIYIYHMYDIYARSEVLNVFIYAYLVTQKMAHAHLGGKKTQKNNGGRHLLAIAPAADASTVKSGGERLLFLFSCFQRVGRQDVDSKFP